MELCADEGDKYCMMMKTKVLCEDEAERYYMKRIV